jgi:hypothetical protein
MTFNNLDKIETILYTTLIQAIDARTGMLELFSGPIVPGKNREEAQLYCYNNGLGYCIVDREFVKVTDSIYKNLN